MRIVFVIPYFYPAWEYGGQPRSAFELAKALVMRGHTVKVLTTDSGGANRLSDIPDGDGSVRVQGIEIVYYRNISNALAFRHRVFWPPQFFRDIRTQLRAADIVHVHELRSTLTVATFRAAKELSVPMVLSSHGGLRHLGRKGVKIVFDCLWGNRILAGVDVLSIVSPLEEYEAKQLKPLPKRVREVPNPVALPTAGSTPDGHRFRSKWAIGDRKLVLFLGRLHWIKGADLLVRAFHDACPAADSNSHLVLAGPDDGHERQLRRLVNQLNLERSVTFTGYLNEIDKLDAFTAADLVVIPSRSEIFAITALEALLCMRPVLLSSVCGISPVLGTAQGVAAFSSENVHDLTVKLSSSLQSHQLRSAAQNGRDFVSREFSLTAVAQKAEAVYREVLVEK